MLYTPKTGVDKNQLKHNWLTLAARSLLSLSISSRILCLQCNEQIQDVDWSPIDCAYIIYSQSRTQPAIHTTVVFVFVMQNLYMRTFQVVPPLSLACAAPPFASFHLQPFCERTHKNRNLMYCKSQIHTKSMKNLKKIGLAVEFY